MQPCGTTTTTSTDNRDSQGYLLPVDEASRPSGPSRSSGVYSYAYDHFRDRFIAFLSVHLRHIQDLYTRWNSGPSSRPSSVPTSQAPSPPDHTPLSSPLISPSPSNEGGSRTGQCACPKSHVTAVSESTHFYENIPNNELTDYADVVA